jgi:biopolymer transport protein ExbD
VKIKGSRAYMLGIESVAMTDIVLNMFIFFFISFSLLYTFSPLRAQKIEVKLPQAANVAPLTDSTQTVITLTGEGAVYLDREPVTMEALKERLSSRVKANPQIVAVLQADRLSRFDQVVAVLDALSGVGISRLNIAAVKEKSK